MPLSDLIGQHEAIGELQAERAADRMSHSYLFEGPAGTGRLTFCKALAQELFCENGNGCGSCKPCEMLSHNNHPDYLELPREPRELRVRRFVTRADTGTEEINHPPVLEFLHLKPAMAERRICVIPDGERMRIGSANAFLKTLEEPPGKSLIMITTAARDRLLSTIVSRCRRVRIAPLTTARLAEELITREIANNDEALKLATVAEGSLGTAMTLAGGDSLESWNWLQEAMKEQTPAGALKLSTGIIERIDAAAKNVQAKRQKAIALLDLAALHIRRRLREDLAPRGAARVLEVLSTAADQIVGNVRLELVMHTMALETMAALRRG